MNDWLKEGETNLIPLDALVLLRQLANEGVAIVVRSSVDALAKEGTTWVIRVSAPVKYGGFVPLYTAKSQADYDQFSDQLLRCLDTLHPRENTSLPLFPQAERLRRLLDLIEMRHVASYLSQDEVRHVRDYAQGVLEAAQEYHQAVSEWADRVQLVDK